MTSLEAPPPAPRTRRKSAHNPRAPRLEPLAPFPEKMPAPIADAIEGVRSYYGHRHRAVPELLRRRRGRKSRKHNRAVAQYQVSRKRSDRTEAICRFLSWAFSHCRLATMEVGVWRDGRNEFQDLVSLARATGLPPRQLDHVISDLVAAAMIYRHQPRQLDDDGEKWSGEVAVLKLTRAAFAAFGVDPARITIYRERADNAAEKVRRREERAAKPDPAVRSLIGGIVGKMVDPTLPRELEPLPRDTLAFNTLCFQIEGETRGEWDGDRVRHEALRRLYPNGRPPPNR